MTGTYRRDDGPVPFPWKAAAVALTIAARLDSTVALGRGLAKDAVREAVASFAAEVAARRADRKLVRAEERAARHERKTLWWREAEIGLVDGEYDE
jgi:hypothetical protein